FIRGQLLTPDTVQTELGVLRGDRAYQLPPGSAVDVLLRPDDIVGQASSPLTATITGKVFLGATTLYRLQLPTGSTVETLLPSHADHPLGDVLPLSDPAEHHVLSR